MIIRKIGIKKTHTPSVAKMTNWSLLVMFLCVTSGSEMSPKSFTQWSPKALDNASPGVLPFGIQTLNTPGSSRKQNTLPLDRVIRSASSAINTSREINNQCSYHYVSVQEYINCERKGQLTW